MALRSESFGARKNRILGADFPLDSERYPIRELLAAFRDVVSTHADTKLILAGRRTATDEFSVCNFLDENHLTDHVEFYPYYDTCREFPYKKEDFDVWLSRDTPAAELTAKSLLTKLDSRSGDRSRTALFFTSFHPGKFEGNSWHMRRWLDHLKAVGYQVHVVYYMYDVQSATVEMRREALRQYNLYLEVDVATRLVGRNKNGLNVHVDDWCGKEAIDAVASLVERFEYDVAIVNYAFMSAVFDKVAAYTRKVLFTHDSFADRNRRMLSEGYQESGWVSLDERGERIACRRADVVVAMQDTEAEYFRRLVGDSADVRVVPPIFAQSRRPPKRPGEKLRVGYFGSSNWVNELNFGEYLKAWLASPELVQRGELVLAGGVCETLANHVPPALIARAAPRVLGRVEDLDGFFDTCDIVINPDRGATGIKVKTLEAMAHGVPVLTTVAGAMGIGSSSRFHAAEDAAALARITAELCADRSLLDVARRETVAAYDAFLSRHRNALDLLFSPLPDAARAPVVKPRRAAPSELVVPEYVRRTAADYQITEFRNFVEQVDIRGKRVLEIGSDFHLATARLFAVNGAAQVVATNIGDWRSDQPVPSSIEFRVGDVGDIPFDDRAFDIIYGIAVLEHIPDLEKVALAIKRLLRPGGCAYLQGCPLWPGTLGHHVWVNLAEGHHFQETFAAGGGAKPLATMYDFADPTKNPIPHWAHLALSPDELAALLVRNEVPPDHAQAIVRYVYGLGGDMIGSHSNFRSSSEIIDVLARHFRLHVDRILSGDAPNEYFAMARARYSEQDLRTLGLEVWLQPADEASPRVTRDDEPTVSIIIPLYNVEDYVDACLKSVIEQDYQSLEIIVVDDASPDRSRQIVEAIAKRDERIHIVTHGRNLGLGPSRNTGVGHATGSYLLFIDSDDLLSTPSAVRTLVSAARASRCNVVAGSCQLLLPDGSFAEFDREFDRRWGGRPGTVVEGLAAYQATMCLEGYSYLPMRAWGSLIDRNFYKTLALEYPPGEHEDLAHTPFLYHQSGGVYYEPAIVVNYRKRIEGISNTAWDAAKARRYVRVWHRIKESCERFGLTDHIGDAATKVAEHLIWKLEVNGYEENAAGDIFVALEEILQDARQIRHRGLFFYAMDRLRGCRGGFFREPGRYRRLTASIPIDVMLEYYAHKGGFERRSPAESLEALPAARSPAAPSVPSASSPPRLPTHGALAANEARVSAVLGEYEAHASRALKALPSMLTVGDKALYFHAARHFGFRGSIVDAGCFLGGSTMSFVEGLRANRAFASRAGETRGLIRAYDLFEVDDGYIREHLRKAYPRHDFPPKSSFLALFRKHLKKHADLLDVHPGDVTTTACQDQQPIEVLGVDLCTALPVTDFVVRGFFPRLLKGALVIQQDFIHEFHPHIHLSMLRLRDYFEPYVEIKWGGSVAYRALKPITDRVIRERFGVDSSWFAEMDVNAALLRALADGMLYDENRWVILLTLGMYYRALGRRDMANAMYREACGRFPQFEASPNTTSMIGA